MDYENRNASPDEMLTRLAEILVKEGWLDDCFFPPIPAMPEYQSPDTPEDDRRSWQQFKERLQKEGIWKEE